MDGPPPPTASLRRAGAVGDQRQSVPAVARSLIRSARRRGPNVASESVRAASTSTGTSGRRLASGGRLERLHDRSAASITSPNSQKSRALARNISPLSGLRPRCKGGVDKLRPAHLASISAVVRRSRSAPESHAGRRVFPASRAQALGLPTNQIAFHLPRPDGRPPVNWRCGMHDLRKEARRPHGRSCSSR